MSGRGGDRLFGSSKRNLAGDRGDLINYDDDTHPITTTGDEIIESAVFPELSLTAEQIFNGG
ncbi:MAG: hypothetical protein MUE44_09615 [Oscillatoriaceae cyanobacterium Prado104]|nr:hypothetical protein [Oscillatoriaceae cyanobacterium Prado104]